MKDRDTRPQPALEEKEVGDLLNKLPTDLSRYIGNFVPKKKRIKTLAGLARTSQGFHRLFQPAAQAEVVKTLSHGIVHGDPDTVYAILHKHPSLLLHTFTVTDPAGYTLKDRTPLQAALCCQDPQMVEGIQNLLIKHYGPKEAARQWDAQFPAGWEEAEKERWERVFRQLEKLDDTIREAEEKDISAEAYKLTVSVVEQAFKLTVREGSAVETELKEFQRLLRATRDEPIKTGRAFNPLLLKELADRHTHYCNVFRYDNPKSLLFWQRIFGYGQRFVSAPDAQAFIVGLYMAKRNLESKTPPQSRNLEMKVWERESDESDNWRLGRLGFYSHAGLGVDYGISVRQLSGSELAMGQMRVDVSLENFYQLKTGAFQKLMPRHLDSSPEHHKTCCSVM